MNVTGNFTISNCRATLTDASYSGSSFMFNYTPRQTSYSYTYNTTMEGIRATDVFSGYQATWVLVFAAGVVVAVIYSAMKIM